MDSAVVISIYDIADGKVVSSSTKTLIDGNWTSTDSRSLVHEVPFDFPNYNQENLCLSFTHLNTEESVIVQELPADADVSNYTKQLNFPTLTKCQNCETNFPTKYQYQRHQCDFNSSQTTFKTYQDNGNYLRETPERSEQNLTYPCHLCEKVFLNKVNLERHQLIHDGASNAENACEFCGKHFVTENRLRIHKENHCKKAGDVSKFYRSDVTVWKCKKCHEVFSSMDNANQHLMLCFDNPGKDENLQTSNIQPNEHKEQPVDGVYFIDETIQPKSNIENVEIISTELLLQCEFCNRTFSDKNFLLMHQNQHTTLKNYECVTCSKPFDSYTSAVLHWMKKCSEYTNVFYLPKLLYCEYCDRTFKSHEVLYNHKAKKKHYTLKLYVGLVNEGGSEVEIKAESKESMSVVDKLVQDVLKTLDVPVLEEYSRTPSVDLTNHISEKGSQNENREEAKENIPPPNKKRKTMGPLIKNKKNGLIEEGFKYQCERCVKVFDCVVSFEAHRSNEHVATFCCKECGQMLGSAKSLLVHCRAHKSLKPYVCDTCGRSYSQTSHLWQHMRFHQGIKPFACPHEGCEARYTIRPDLKDHIRKVHTRERPFKCNVCNKCFLTGSVYYQHRLIHTNDRRYGCEICNKRFFRADALNNHKRIHTDERPYPCSVCGREFRQKGDRNKHMRTQHPDSYNMTS